MKLKSKILLISILPLLLSVCIIGVTIVEMRSLKSSTEEIVQLLVDVEALNGHINSTQKSLSAYSLNMTGSNANDAMQDLAATQKSFERVSGFLVLDEQKQIQQRIVKKLEELQAQAALAIEKNNAAEAKRQSLRTKGIINDVHQLKSSVNQQYQNMQIQLENNINGIITFSIIAAIVLVAGSSAFSIIFTNRIVTPIRRITEQSERIANGDLTSEEIVVKSRDEVFALNASFSKMTGNLREIIEHVSNSSSQLAASSEELLASAEETMRGSERITKAIQHVRKGAEQQSLMAAESTRAVEESAIGITRIAENASVVSELTYSTTEKAKQGSTLVNTTLSQMAEIVDAVQTTSGIVTTLDQRSKEINEIVSLITQIADQTNLLALNAAIEAARAGQAGRGFAIVADEVRKLAEQTRSSATHISEIIQEVQADTVATVESIQAVKEKVDLGLQGANHTAVAFKDILNSVEQVGDQIQDISAVSQQISAGSQQVASSVNEVANVADHTSKNSEDVAKASEEQLASMQDVSQAAVSLSRLAEELQHTVSRFKR
ncbi:MAG TPA: methyl-accepting chemotaxis protein [Candidatus Bathyarchaeia archaeon]|nr:methyl-accepting chemotaxis protein [Candidatus Bathyarchaeia archaeon]